MARRDSVIDEEKRSYGALWLVLSLLLFVAGLWAIADDYIFRRPWKYYQERFSQMEIAKVKEAIAAEQARLDQDPEYQKAVKALEEATAQVQSGETGEQIAQLEKQLERARLEDVEKDLNLRFVKSELEELRFLYDDAMHHGREDEAQEVLEKIRAKEQLQVERQAIYSESQERIAKLEAEIKAKQAAVKAAQDALAKLTATRDDLQQKLETISLGRYPAPSASPPFIKVDWVPKIPKIQQVVLEEYDRNSYQQPVARVDRCMSCHTGIDKKGFEDAPQPYRTHPKREQILGPHPVDKIGCTPCHNGDGPNVNSARGAHANYYDEHGQLHEVHLREELALFRGPMMQANCLKCHPTAVGLEGGEIAARGETLFIELGCHGCHLAEGYETLAKQNDVSIIGPSLRRIGAKVEPGWLVRWIRNPHQFRPRTRMPNFMFDETQATQIAAFLLAATKDSSAAWVSEHPAPDVPRDPQTVAAGKALVDSIGCRACHALAPDEVAGQIGANKDIAPNLSAVAEKTDARWLYHWVKNPRGFSDIARMPSLRLTDDEARAVTAYLLTLGAPQPAPPPLLTKLRDPGAVAAGEKLVRKYGCAGCHDIPGMELESRIGAELSTYGNKTKEELFFGDRIDLHEDWATFTFHKLKEPRGYATKWIEQVMPQFNLADEDIEALMVFLRGRTEAKIKEDYRYSHSFSEAVVRGQRLVARYNCTGCHIIEGRGGDIRRLYEKNPSEAPPNLLGEGQKVQAPWLYAFLQAPTTIRPWLSVRMPTFGLSDEETVTLVHYFQGLDGVTSPFTYIEVSDYVGANVEAGRMLASADYLSCFSCHVRGNTFPEGEKDSWAPDLAMAAKRLRPAWIVDWLHDPQKLLPGTKMPSFYADPDNPDGPPDILGGDDDAQIRALRDYVISIGLAQAGQLPTQMTRVQNDQAAVQ
ncbi:MAG TPA: c-type cytochrome [Candidatus Limnocylindria bacterium]|nr:c-type cytochrome [Candidatus Limnocylindria bacterium]